MTAMESAPTRKIDLIWSITRVCMWDCANCCVDAVHVSRKGQNVAIRRAALTEVNQISYQTGAGSVYDQASAWLQNNGAELNLQGKLRVLDHLAGFRVKIDFSGGDPLSTKETMLIMREASHRFGRQQVTLTATGAGLARCNPEEIIPLIGELNFTYDNVSMAGNEHRPAGYANGNLRAAAKFARAGVIVRGECPLSTHNCSPAILRHLYQDLQEAGVQTLLLMRLFPVGRGILVASDIPTVKQYQEAIEVLREMELRYGSPRVKLQCALKYLDSGNLTENPCDMVAESFGLMADGTLLASPWAFNAHSKPLHESWVLGNLATTPLGAILDSPKVQTYFKRGNDNFGHCKIFSFIHSNCPDPADRIFDPADPLYSQVGVV